MRKIIFLLAPIFIFAGVLLGYAFDKLNLLKFQGISEKQVLQARDSSLDRYSFNVLKNTSFKESGIKIGKLLKDEKDFSSYVFYFTVEDEKVSGLMNVPKKDGVCPVIVMFRGYVDRDKYKTGEGTRHSGEIFAANGYITLAPDFLGYGESDTPSVKPLEERFQTYTTALSLLASVENLNKTLENIKCHSELVSESGSRNESRFNRDEFGMTDNKTEINTSCININIHADTEKIGIWGHSNGGHIALSVLEITGENYPTILWAPVSKPFPYSILYYTDEFEDNGKALRKLVADFEKDYDADKYSPSGFFDWINADIQLHQGGEDEAVPQRWSDEFVEKMQALGKNIDYYTYSGEDHNFSKGNWSTVVERSIEFYKENL